MDAVTRTLHLEYFAGLREQRGLAHESITSPAATAAELFDELAARYHFTIDRARTRVAVNDRLVDWVTRLEEGDRIVFLTPFGGG